MSSPLRVVLHDVDSRIPNLALMKLSAFYKSGGAEVLLNKVRSPRPAPPVEADLHLASMVFRTEPSADKVAALISLYGDRIAIGGSGYSLEKRLPEEAEQCFPDYSLYHHRLFAIGFLTRGCNKRCPFCIVPAKEGRIKLRASSFDDFVPRDQRNVLLLDDNLLSFDGVHSLLQEMIDRDYAVNFSQTLDIAYLDETKFELLRRIDTRNARFTKRMIYFSLNFPPTVRLFRERRDLLKGFGKDAVAVVCLFGFDTTLQQDYERFLCLRQLRLIPFFQEYWPIDGVPSRVPENFFDMDLAPVIRMTFRSNGLNWEKYLRWLNGRYFERFGRYYQPLVEIIYRYNNRQRLQKYLAEPGMLTTELYRDFRGSDSPLSRGRIHRRRRSSGVAGETPETRNRSREKNRRRENAQKTQN